MSKLPYQTRRIRLPSDLARIVEKELAPLTGKKLEAAQAAVLRVYESGKQMSAGEWITTYVAAIKGALESVSEKAAA